VAQAAPAALKDGEQLLRYRVKDFRQVSFEPVPAHIAAIHYFYILTDLMHG
jgi:hypothetical protein